MVNTADSRLRLDLARLSQRCLDDPIAGCALIQGYVGSVLVIIRQIFTSKPSKVVFVQRDDVIQELAASTAGPSFGDSILPRAPQTRSTGSMPLDFRNAKTSVPNFGRDQTVRNDKGRAAAEPRAAAGQSSLRSDVACN
jgi:hypothetical protein